MDGRAEAQQLHTHTHTERTSGRIKTSPPSRHLLRLHRANSNGTTKEWGEVGPNNAPNKFHHGQTTQAAAILRQEPLLVWL